MAKKNYTNFKYFVPENAGAVQCCCRGVTFIFAYISYDDYKRIN